MSGLLSTIVATSSTETPSKSWSTTTARRLGDSRPTHSRSVRARSPCSSALCASTDDAIAHVKASTVFTTHTPVPAGNEIFGTALIRRYVVPLANEAGIPEEYLLSLGWRRAVSFQPSDRFWTFQAIEAGIFLALAAVIVVVTLRLVQRTPA